MLKHTFAGSFKNDLKLMAKRRRDDKELGEIIQLLINEQPLPQRCRPHLLHGKKWEGKWECHAENDWLLVYEIDPVAQKIIFHRTGTHSDLFKK